MRKRKKYFIFFYVLMILIYSASCTKKLEYIEREVNIFEENIPFEYIHSDDVPLGGNIVFGGDLLQYSNGYIYFQNGGANVLGFPENQTLWKYNIATNNLTTVCPDPLCKHNIKDCPLFAMDTMYIYDNKVLFYSRYKFILDGGSKNAPVWNEWAGFIMYDIPTGKYNLRNEINPSTYVQNVRQLFVDNYCLYYDYIYNENIEEWVFAVCRWDLTTNEVVVLGGLDNIYNLYSGNLPVFASTFLFSIDSRIFFTDGQMIFSTDINYENRIDHLTGSFLLDVYTDGEYIYYGVPVPREPDDYLIQSIRRVDFDGQNDIELGIVSELGRWNITTNYIYYKKYDKIAIGKNMTSEYPGQNINMYNSEIWRCSHDGTNHELVYKFEGDMANYRIESELYVGNYIYGIYERWTDSNNDNVFKDGDQYRSGNYENYSIMRIDINTGEIYYIKVD
jgi:hypothetical protein